MKSLPYLKQETMLCSLKESWIKTLNDFNIISPDNDNDLFDTIKEALNQTSDTDYYWSTQYDLWFLAWYESALNEIINHFTSINICDEWLNQPSKTFKSTQLEDMFRNLIK